MRHKKLPPARYEYGADEFIFVELDEEMSLEANFKASAICQELAYRNLPGVIDICPSNASYMVRFDPDVIAPQELMAELQRIESQVGDVKNVVLRTRVIDVPVLYNDPWTHETLMRFRDRHQDPNATDLEYCARINGYKSVQDFIKALSGSPWMVTMVGFVPGLPWCVQLVERHKQIQAPKYVRPRTDTPERAFGFGGCFACIYPVRGAGGYQLFGICAAPVFDPDQRLPDFQESMVFPRPGDIFVFRSVDRDEYDAIRDQVEKGVFRYRVRPFEFHPDRFLDDPERYNEEIMGVLYND